MHAACRPLVVVISAVLSPSQSTWHPLRGAKVLLLEHQFILSPLCSRMFSLSAKPHTWHRCPHLIPPFSNCLWKTDPLCVSLLQHLLAVVASAPGPHPPGQAGG